MVDCESPNDHMMVQTVRFCFPKPIRRVLLLAIPGFTNPLYLYHGITNSEELGSAMQFPTARII